MISKCIICGEEFIPKNQLAQICYKEHYKKCKYCGEKFLIKKMRYLDRDFCFKKECVDKSRTENRKRYNLENLGVEHHMQLKENIDKMLDTNKKNHDGKLAWNTEKQKQTMIKKYGVDNPGKSKESRNKGKKTCLERYGSETYNNSKKSLKMFRRRYKLQSASQLQFTDEQKEIILNKNNFEKYIDDRYKDYIFLTKIYKELNINHTVFFRYLDKYDLRKKYKFRHNISYPEIEIREFIIEKFPDIKIISNFRKYIKVYGEIDIYLPELNFGIEFNGIRWHDKEKYLVDLQNNHITCRELIKSKNFKENLNVDILHIWGDDFKHNKEKILNNLVDEINKHLL